MAVTEPEAYLASHRLFAQLEPEQVRLLAAHASRRSFSAQAPIFRQGGDAERCYLIITGDVSLELVSAAGAALTIQTLGPGEMLGSSWLFPPYRWHFDARAVSATDVFTLDAVGIREACDRDPVLGYALMKRLSQIFHERMQAARMQIIDLYGPLSEPVAR